MLLSLPASPSIPGPAPVIEGRVIDGTLIERGTVVEGIVIEGNDRTHDEVIRRELASRPGETFDAEVLASDLQRLNRLNYFDQVEMALEPGSTRPLKLLRIRVREKQTWLALPGGGYTSADGLMIGGTFIESNLGGRGLTVTLGGTWSRNPVASLEFKQPWLDGDRTALSARAFLARPLNPYLQGSGGSAASAGSAVYAGPRATSPPVAVLQQGATLTLSRPLFGEPVSTWWRGALGLHAERDSVEDPATVAPAGPFVVTSVKAELTFDSRDSLVAARGGTFWSASAETYLPGLSTNPLTRLRMAVSQHFPLPWQQSLALGARAGRLFALGQGGVPAYERFYPLDRLGNLYLVRGWPVAPTAQELATFPFGGYSGDAAAWAGAEYRFPIAWIVSGVVFADTGLLWDAGPAGIAWRNTRSGYGVGLRIDLPATGPYRIDYGLHDGDIHNGFWELAASHKF